MRRVPELLVFSCPFRFGEFFARPLLESTSVRRRGAIRFERVLGLFSESLDLGSVSVSEPDDDEDDDDDEDSWDAATTATSSLSLDWDSDSEYDPLFLKCLTLMDPVAARVV